MDELYQGLPNSNLTYVIQTSESANELANMLASYSESGFSSFKSQKNTANNAKPVGSFIGTTITSSYSKAVHERFYAPVYSHSNYYYRSLSEHSQENELEKFNQYLAQTNQEQPNLLKQMLADKQSNHINKNQHQNVIVASGNPHGVEIEEEDGVDKLAYGNLTYNGRGNSSYSRWARHGNFTHTDYYSRAYSNSHSDYSRAYSNSHYDYSRYSNSHYDYSRYSNSHYDTDYYDYKDKYHNDPNGNVSNVLYDKYTYPVKTTVNYSPTQPEIYLQEILNNMQNTVTIGYYSYDRNIVTGNSGLSKINYKIELRKTSGPNQQSWKVIQDSANDKITFNPLDPFNMGWTKTTQGYGNYELRITPYNLATTVSEDGWAFNAPQTYGTPLTVNFRIAINNEATVQADGNSPTIGAVVYMDGATKGGNSYTYDQFYGSSVPSSNRKGIYMALSVSEPDNGQYLTGTVNLKNRTTGAIIKTVPIVWSNSSQVIASSGGTVSGYVFIPASSLLGQKFNGQLEVVVDQYYNSACTDKASNTTIRQNVVGNGNTTLLNTAIDMQKTLNYDSISITPNTTINQKPTVTVKVNQQNHLKGSYSKLEYSWSKSETTPSTWNSTTNSVLSTQPSSEGKWYLHLKAYDKYGNSLTELVGPVYYSNIAMTVAQPTVTHFDDTDRVTVKTTFASKPNLPVTYQYRYGYRPKGSTAEYTFSTWTSNPEAVTPNTLAIYNGVELVSEIKLVEIDEVRRSIPTTVTINDKLAWNIKNQANSNYNLESTSLPYNKIHNSSGTLTDGFKLMTNLSPELSSSLRDNEFYYYKLVNGAYKFKKIIYFDDPISN